MTSSVVARNAVDEAFVRWRIRKQRLHIGAAQYDWPRIARAKQLPPPGDWAIWLLITGRGFGKTRAGAEEVRRRASQGLAGRIALVAPTAADTRDVMVEGESGVLAVSPPDDRPRYEPSKRRLTWPNGAMAFTYSAEEPDRLRGPQHDFAWSDEIGSWKYGPDTWDMLQFGLRLGQHPQQIVTTTPRPVRVVRDLVKREGHDVVVVRGTTHENRANLAPAFLATIVRRYEGTRLGRQELEGELLEDVPGALWNRAELDAHRVAPEDVPALRRVVVAIDPAVTSSDQSDETGIIVAGVDAEGHGYVLEDRSCRVPPVEWARIAIAEYHRWEASRVIGEVNNGGDMIESTLRTVDRTVAYTAVRATRGKYTRAEPISALYEQGNVSHAGSFPDLEDQLVTWTADTLESPDRLDALVWALTELMLGDTGPPRLRFLDG